MFVSSPVHTQPSGTHPLAGVRRVLFPGARKGASCAEETGDIYGEINVEAVVSRGHDSDYRDVFFHFLKFHRSCVAQL